MGELEKEFVPYGRSLRLKALGFDEPCLAFYYDKTKFLSLGQKPEYLVDQRKASYIFGNEKHGVTLAPTFSQAFKWFRDLGFGIIDKPFHSIQSHPKVTYALDVIEWKTGRTWKMDRKPIYEDAQLACLDKLLEITESK